MRWPTINVLALQEQILWDPTTQGPEQDLRCHQEPGVARQNPGQPGELLSLSHLEIIPKGMDAAEDIPGTQI